MNHLSDNEYIKEGHRERNKSHSYYIQTMFQYHNQLGILLLCILRFVMTLYQLVCFIFLHKINVGIMAFIIGGLIQSICSFVYHLFASMPLRYALMYRNIDLTSIAYHALMQTILVISYYERNGVSVYIIGFITCLNLFFNYEYFQYIHTKRNEIHLNKSTHTFQVMILTLGWYIHIIIQSWMLSSPQTQYENLTFALTAGFYLIIGGYIYKYRFPEKYFLGRFDYIFNSHQLLHACVVSSQYYIFQVYKSL
jgi:hypothetical protein